MINIRFEVKKKVYRNNTNGYTVARVGIKKYPDGAKVPTAEPTIVGNFPAIHVRDEFEASGRWVDNGAYGLQFEINTCKMILPETSKGMIQFLSRMVEGIGKSTASRIVEEFKEDTFSALINNHEEIAKIKGIGKAKSEILSKNIKNLLGVEDVMCFLAPMGLNHSETFTTYEVFGYSAIGKVRKDPYCLTKKPKISFKKADTIAKELKFSPDNNVRICEGILLYIENEMNNKGDMFVFEESIIKDLALFLSYSGGYNDDENSKVTKQKIKECLEYLLVDRRIIKEEDEDKRECVYIYYYKHIEDTIVETISNMINIYTVYKYSDIQIFEFLKEHQKITNLKLAKGQVDALKMALNNKLSILSGGPGTGKTQTINSIIKCIEVNTPKASIKLAAPTGRAAKRMTELTGRKSQTIHRLIGLNNLEDDDKQELIPIESDFLIIDESSMIDAQLFFKTLSVISEETKILLVGDYEQIPSVGPGLILRDLINSKVVPTTILTKIFRQAQDSQIVMNAYKIKNGIKSTDKNGSTFNPNKEDFYFIKRKDVSKIKSTIIKAVRRLLETGFTFDDIQVLSVMNKGELGVKELNRIIQEEFNPNKDMNNEIQVGVSRYLRVEDRVMQTINNYDLNVFNGEVGKVISMNIEGLKREKDFKMIVDFGDRTVAYDTKTIRELNLAYAITVHKSQGSEFKAVIMPFHSSLNILLNRNLMYTAVTRAKERIIAIGDIKEWDKGIGKTMQNSRNSQIQARLTDKKNQGISAEIAI